MNCTWNQGTIPFMASYSKSFPKSKLLGNRDKYLLTLVKNKRVVHIGCTDWPNQIEQIQNGSLLHSKLREHAVSIAGVDVDADGINHLSNIFPSDLFFCGDISNSILLQEQIIELKPEVILVPDVLEHIENQREFLSGLYSILVQTEATAYITTPNAFALKTFLPLFIGKDFTHVDHCLIHNEFTLIHALQDSKFKEIKINYFARDISGRYGLLAQAISAPIDTISKFFPRFGDTLVAEIRP